MILGLSPARRFVWTALVASLFAAAHVHAQPMADYVPADAVGFVSSAGAADPAAGYATSITRKLLVDAGVGETFATQFRNLEQFVDQQAESPDDRQAVEMMRSFRQCLTLTYDRPWVAYVQMNPENMGDDDAPLQLIWLVKPSDDANRKALLGYFNDVKERSEKAIAEQGAEDDAKLSIIDAADVVGLAIVGYGMPEFDPASFRKPAQSIAGDAGFKAATKQVMGKHAAPLLFAWVRTQPIYDAIMYAMENKSGEGDDEEVAAVLDAYGLNSVKQFAYATGFDAQGSYWTSMFIDAPAPRSGMVAAVLDTPAISEEQLTAVPRNATWFRAGTLDLPGILDAIRKAQPQMPEDLRFDLDEQLGQLNELAGFDVEHDLIDAMGPQWIGYSDISTQMFFGPGVCLVNRTQDPQKVSASLEQIAQIITEHMPEDAQGGPQVRFGAVESAGVKMYTFNMMAFTPSWAVVGDNFYLGVTPQAISSAKIYQDQNPAGITKSEDFLALRKQLPDNLNSLMYANLPEAAPQMYQMVTMLTNMLAAVNPEASQQLMAVMPPLPAIMPYLQPAGSGAWTDDAGYHSESIQPFPFASLFSSELTTSQFTPAMAVGIMLPALSVARRSAREMTSNTQMRGIHQACVTYAQTAKGKFPPDIFTLYQGNYFTADYVVSPSGAHVPDDFAQWPESQQREWFRENASYVLIPGLTDDLDSQKIAVFAKPADSPQGPDKIGVTFNDGHTETMLTEDAAVMLKQQTGKTMDQLILESEQAPPAPAPGSAPGNAPEKAPAERGAPPAPAY